jgi:hypothetical protein
VGEGAVISRRCVSKNDRARDAMLDITTASGGRACFFFAVGGDGEIGWRRLDESRSAGVESICH